MSWPYNRERPHRGINLEVPVPYLNVQQFQSPDGVERADLLGGLLHANSVAA